MTVVSEPPSHSPWMCQMLVVLVVDGAAADGGRGGKHGGKHPPRPLGDAARIVESVA
jgi:hypothetical protein